MKKNIYIYLVAFCCVATMLFACKKTNNDDPTELSKLPAATQAGANTIGCVVNSKVFLPASAAFTGPSYQCNYQYINGAYYFLVQETDDTDMANIYGISINTNALALVQGQSYDLKSYGLSNTAYASYTYYHDYSLDNYKTNTLTGKLTITKLDQTKQIISGTFYYNAVSSKGDTVHVTDGRFDMQYTQ